MYSGSFCSALHVRDTCSDHHAWCNNLLQWYATRRLHPWDYLSVVVSKREGRHCSRLSMSRLKQWTYLVPLVFLIWEGVCLTAIWGSWLKRRKKKQLHQSEATVRVVQLPGEYALSNSRAVSSSPVSKESREGSFTGNGGTISTAL